MPAACAVALGGASDCRGPGHSGEATLVIGAILPLSGSDGSRGEQLLSGMELRAAAEKGLPVEIVAADGAGEPVASARRLANLAADARVTAVVGGGRASTGRVLAAVSAGRRMPVLALSPLAAPGGHDAPTIHSLHRIESLAAAAAVWARETLGASTAGIFRDDHSEASWRLGETFLREFTARGGEIAWTVGVDENGRVERAGGPEEPLEVIFVGGPATVVRELAGSGPQAARASFVVVQGWGEEPSLADGTELCVVGFHWLEEERETVVDFVDACRAAGVEATRDRADGWDAVSALVVAALEGGVTRDGLERSLRAGEPIEGVGGSLALRGAAETPVMFRAAADGVHLLGRLEARFVAPAAPAVP